MADGFALDIDDTRVLAVFDGLPSAFRRALEIKCSVLALLLEAKIKGKLTNDVLNVITGRLRRSIHTRVYVDGDVVHAEAASSADVPYAAIHEFGFVGTEHVREYVRSPHERVVGAVLGTKGEILRSARVISVSATTVRAHDRKTNMPERSFLRSSLAEMSDDIVHGLQDAVNEVRAQ